MKTSRGFWGVVLVAAIAALAPRAPEAQTFNSGSTGADGAFSPSSNTTVTLPPNGIFNFTTVNIPAGVTVTFLGNQANTPVFMLAQGDVTITGTINVDGAAGGSKGSGFRAFPNGGAGGPGGYAGGTGGDGSGSVFGGAGLGPGGGKVGCATFSGVGCGGGGGGFSASGSTDQSGISAGGPAYGNDLNLPLVGGSGAGGGGGLANNFGGGGGGGGGAILIASTTRVTLTGTIFARGGAGGGTPSTTPIGGHGGGGSGGAVRLIATTLAGTGGTISTAGGAAPSASSPGYLGGAGAIGRIRLEGYSRTLSATTTGSISVTTPGGVFLPGNPTLAIPRIGGVNVTNPVGSYGTPDITLPAGTPSSVTVDVAATNIPLSPPVTVTVTVSPLSGTPTNYASSVLAGTDASSTASASVTLPTTQVAALIVTATFNVVLAGGAPLMIDGEEVEKIKVAALLGRPTKRFYITKAGREIPIP